MGANAQTTVPTFVASQVLTADQQNQSARTGVPVFSSTVTRDAAFGGTGEKTLAEGQLCYVEGTGLQTYNAAGAWVTWGAAPSAGLTLISTTTIGSAVSSVTVSGAFSSTYDNYKVIVSGGSASASINLTMILGATATGYYAGYNQITYSNNSTANTGADKYATSWTKVASANTNGIGAHFDLLAPNLAKNTFIVGGAANNDTAGNSRTYSGFLNDTTAYTAFTFTTSSGTITGGTIKVYGYQNS
jgi:hypothetical protein